MSQKNVGAEVDLLSHDRLQERFPYINTTDITAGIHGLSGEGWYDPMKLLTRLKLKCQERGVDFVEGEAVGFRYTIDNVVTEEGHLEIQKRLQDLDVLHADGRKYPMRFAICICCAGAWTPEIFKMAGIGYDSEIHGALGVPLPVKARKRHTYLIHCPGGPGLNMPIIVDRSGLTIRREGIAGYYMITKPEQTKLGVGELADDYDADFDFYEKEVKPILDKRLPCFSEAKLHGGWSHYEDVNIYDHNLVVGNHPYHNNFYMITGGAEHSMQQAYSAAYYISDNIVEMRQKTEDFANLNFDRFIEFVPLTEKMNH